MTLNEKIGALIDASNEVTNQNNSDLTNAVKSLIQGYGSSTVRKISYLPMELGEINSYGTYTVSNYGIRTPYKTTVCVRKGSKIKLNLPQTINITEFRIYLDGVKVLDSSSEKEYTFTQDGNMKMSISTNNMSFASTDYTNYVQYEYDEIKELPENYNSSFPPPDGKTRIWIDVDENCMSPRLGIILNGTATVDWGDGSALETISGTASQTEYLVSGTSVNTYTSNHTYGSVGKYCITLNVNGTWGLPTGNNACRLLSYDDNYSDLKHIANYATMIRKIQLGDGISAINSYAFYRARNLEEVQYNLSHIKKMGIQVFNTCTPLKSFIIPAENTSISQYTFWGTTTLKNIVIPSKITVIGDHNFSSCPILSNIYFFPTTPPTVSNTSIWDSAATTTIPTSCVIHVPKDHLNDYKNAADYPDPTKYTYKDDILV